MNISWDDVEAMRVYHNYTDIDQQNFWYFKVIDDDFAGEYEVKLGFNSIEIEYSSSPRTIVDWLLHVVGKREVELKDDDEGEDLFVGPDVRGDDNNGEFDDLFKEWISFYDSDFIIFVL